MMMKKKKKKQISGLTNISHVSNAIHLKDILEFYANLIANGIVIIPHVRLYLCAQAIQNIKIGFIRSQWV